MSENITTLYMLKNVCSIAITVVEKTILVPWFTDVVDLIKFIQKNKSSGIINRGTCQSASTTVTSETR